MARFKVEILPRLEALVNEVHDIIYNELGNDEVDQTIEDILAESAGRASEPVVDTSDDGAVKVLTARCIRLA